MSSLRPLLAAIGAVATAASAASAGFTITQGNSAPTYSDFALNFDEPGTPTGVVPQDTWLASHGVLIDSGTGDPAVGDFSGDFPWVNSGNALYANFGLFLTSVNDMTAFSIQVWDPSGPPSPIGGGLFVFLFNDGQEVAGGSFTPAWGTDEGSWFDIVASDGMVFDEVRILGFGFAPTTFVDNLSWNVIPSPAGLALLAMGGLVSRRRRA